MKELDLRRARPDDDELDLLQSEGNKFEPPNSEE